MEESEYELMRKRNIEEKNAILQSLLPKLRDCIPSSDETETKTTGSKPKKVSTPRARKQKVPVEPRRSIRIEKRNRKIKRVKGFKGFKLEKVDETTRKTGYSPWQAKLSAARTKNVQCTSAANSDVLKVINSILDAIYPNKGNLDCDSVSDPDAQYRWVYDTDDSDDDWDEYEQVVFYETSEEEEEDEDEEEDTEKFIRKRRVQRSQHQQLPLVLPPEEITQKMLQNIARSARKKYSSDLGTCCHQCRQKTLDTKTMCRSGSCVGVRGQFCGPCLSNRYGEKVSEALMDPGWSCPPCRSQCNCSICLTRIGKAPTGILTPFVKSEGYDSVAQYLMTEKVDTKVKKKSRRVVGYREAKV